MTRLTEQQVFEAWEAEMYPHFAPLHVYRPLTVDAITTFAHRIAALAVQEVEREYDRLLGERTGLLERAWGAEAEVATLTAQLAEARAYAKGLEDRMPDALRQAANAGREALATAKREGAREALTRLAEMQFGGPDLWSQRSIKQWRDREYPATPSGEGVKPLTSCKHLWREYDCAKCGAERVSTPSPEAREDDEYWVVVRDDLGNIAPYNVRITPADAKRIVELAQEAE